jgi:DNA-binding MurR/RpiR family transcriptional regulator
MTKTTLLHQQRPNALLRNRERLTTFSKAVKRVADVAAADPMGVTRMTVEELASRAKCSEGTVIRWCKELGFQGFQEVKLSLAVETALQTAQDSSQAHTITNTFADTFSYLRQALQDSEHNLNPDALTQVANALDQARTVLIVGVGASTHVAHYLQYQLLRAGVHSSVHAEVHSALMAASVLPAGSVLVAVSNSGSTKETNEVISSVTSEKVITVALTNHPNSRLTRTADITLLAGYSTDDPLAGGSAASVIAQIALTACLLEALVRVNPERASAPMHTAESVLAHIF